jgi:hypothetical protein
MATGGVVSASVTNGMRWLASNGPSTNTTFGLRAAIALRTWRAVVGEWCRTGNQ